MSSLETYLEMLSSPRADTRYDACEGLRAADESSESVVLALEKAINDPSADVADAAKKALHAVVHQEMLEKMGRAMPRSETELRDEEQAQALAAIPVVTTPAIDGCRVAEYLGVVSAEVALSAGFLAELNAGVAGLSGGRIEGVQDQLKEAGEIALRELRLRALDLGANAVLGVSLHYATLSTNVLIVVAAGTAVRVEPA